MAKTGSTSPKGTITFTSNLLTFIISRLRKIEELPLKSEEQSLQPVGLCGVPFHQLQEQALQETEAASLSRSKEKYAAREDLDSGIESGEEESTELWVEKFRPRYDMIFYK